MPAPPAVPAEDDEDDDDYVCLAPPYDPESDPLLFGQFRMRNGVRMLMNCRGDLLTEQYEWSGRYDPATKSIDIFCPKPDYLEEA
jgi:hypothetical protein